MRQKLIFNFLVLSCILISFSRFTVQAIEVPPLTGPVIDQANLLSPNQKNILSKLLKKVATEKGHQLQILTVKNLEGETIEEFSIKVVDQWKLGQKGEDTGVLFLISINDKKMRIEVGDGLEGTLTDYESHKIIQQVRPLFKSGRYDEGILHGTRLILSKLGITSIKTRSNQSSRTRRRSGFSSFSTIAFFILMIFFRGRRSSIFYASGIGASRGSVVLEGIALEEGHLGAVAVEVSQGEALLEAGKKRTKMKILNKDVNEIKSAVKHAEKRTSGEIVPVILNKSDEYLYTHYLLALIFSIMGILIVDTFSINIIDNITTVIILSLIGFFLPHIDSIKRILLTKKEVQEEVNQKALQLFYEQGLQNTKDGTGVLIYISILEKKAIILADKGINKIVGTDYWDNEIKKLISFIKSKKMTEGVCEIISDIGGKLSEHFPVESDDKNELKNDLITDLKII